MLDQNLSLIHICLQHTQSTASYQITYRKEFSSINPLICVACGMVYYLGLSEQFSFS